MTAEEKFAQMSLDASFDVADDEAETVEHELEQVIADTKSKASLPKVPKVFVSNNCSFNCAYCGCRNSLDKQRYCHSPKEIAEISVSEAYKNKRGIFITSAIERNADYTQELIIKTLKIIRNEFDYKGYVHAKVMPGADPLLIKQTGMYANRLSVNIEVAKSESYEKIAKQKNKNNILTPMQNISDLIQENIGYSKNHFASSQTTQLMAGSSNEDDRVIINLAQALYKKYNLKRVYYTPFQYVNTAKGYDLDFVSTPKWRQRRLYQADRLLQLYNFSIDEITPDSSPYLEENIDPKTAWALRNLNLFPVEINTADYDALIRIPGIGTTYAKRILQARKYTNITFDILKKLKISLKRCGYFITCNGKFMREYMLDNPDLKNLLEEENQAKQLVLI